MVLSSPFRFLRRVVPNHRVILHTRPSRDTSISTHRINTKSFSIVGKSVSGKTQTRSSMESTKREICSAESMLAQWVWISTTAEIVGESTE
ncbi:hypothetical protein B0H10DRAFT_2071112 [Mycena sp. CBHHK59/15]|nr:hypothetical protein B0H10DRAFT_2071112 [Mycena sp. CBHHK59/15]